MGRGWRCRACFLDLLLRGRTVNRGCRKHGSTVSPVDEIHTDLTAKSGGAGR